MCFGVKIPDTKIAPPAPDLPQETATTVASTAAASKRRSGLFSGQNPLLIPRPGAGGLGGLTIPADKSNPYSGAP